MATDGNRGKQTVLGCCQDRFCPGLTAILYPFLVCSLSWKPGRNKPSPRKPTGNWTISLPHFTQLLHGWLNGNAGGCDGCRPGFSAVQPMPDHHALCGWWFHPLAPISMDSSFWKAILWLVLGVLHSWWLNFSPLLLKINPTQPKSAQKNLNETVVSENFTHSKYASRGIFSSLQDSTI